jgi:cellulose synthase/poly-beta-1,6-N-acetylglucosamine synthase-like glycosyltransferase
VLANSHRGGISGARNTGLAAARSEVVAFLDDDALPEPTWLERLLAPYSDPAVQVVGGLARPVWPGDRRPDHLVAELDWIVGCTHHGHPTSRGDVRNPVGANMSLRRAVVDEVGGFDENVSRHGTVPLGCDDTEFCIRLVQRRPGSRVVFEPTAVVHHHVTPERTTWAYLRSRARAEGLSKATVAALVGPAAATAAEKQYVRQVLPGAVRRELRHAVSGDRSGWRGAAGVLTALAFTSWGYAEGRLKGSVAAVSG